jgi:hypothetical protein
MAHASAGDAESISQHLALIEIACMDPAELLVFSR